MTLTSHQQSSCSMSSSARQCTRLRTIPKTLSNPVLGKASSRLRKQLRPFVAEQLPAKKECATRYLVVSSSGYSNSSTDARIKVIGVGGGGGNALNRMVETGLQGIEFWAVNTDVQALVHHRCTNRMQIGSEVTRGLGCGGNPQIGRSAAQESQEGLKQVVSGADLVFVTAGMGGGTGTGAAPVVAQISKQAGEQGMRNMPSCKAVCCIVREQPGSCEWQLQCTRLQGP
eukprot:GHRR01020480.1.p1 GENE.GHRR01020480.1~~GHRR01020480.1.p1  ORF type:complete len:229 (+),score=54.07 GHRR01020480.1:342-1028(+)